MDKQIVKSIAIVFVVILIFSMSRFSPAIFANPDSSYTVQPVAIPPLTNSNFSLYGLDVTAEPNPVGDNFTVYIHLRTATGVSRVEVHFYFGNILRYAVPTGFTDFLGTSGEGGVPGVLTGPQAKLLYGVTSGIYDAKGIGPLDFPYAGGVEYKSAAASTGAPIDVTDGLIAKITFMITAQPPTDVGDQFLPLVLDFTDIVATSTKGPDIQGMLTLRSVPFTYPPRPYIFVDPASETAAIGQIFSVNVEIDADSFWDVATYDITFTYDPTLLSLVSITNGTFLGSDVFGFNDTSLPGVVHAVSTKLRNPVPSGGVGTLLILQFNVTCHFSHQPVSCNLTLGNTDLGGWAHPGRKYPPWNGPMYEVEYFYDPRPVPPALPWSHYTINSTFSVNLGDVNNDGIINLQDMFALAQAYGSHRANYHYQGEPASPNWNERANLAPPFGQIGLTDLVTFPVYYNSH